jgi:nickel/cobalt exporter
MIAVVAGLVAGAAHALSGPDHVAAVLPFAAEDRASAVRTGLSWGVGHGLGVMGLGAVGLALRAVVDVHALSGWAEGLVGVALIGTGVYAVSRALGRDVPHTHAPHAALGVGVLHGAAGGAHLSAALVALALPWPSAVGWLVAFLVGATVAMGGVGLAVTRGGSSVTPAAWGRARLGFGALSVGVGTWWLGAAFASTAGASSL